MNYETAEDISREDEVAAAFAEAWRCKVHRNKPFYEIDRTLTKDGIVVAVMEIKCRSDEFKSKHVYLSLNKWLKGRQIADTLGCSFVAAYRLPTGIHFYVYKPGNDDHFICKVVGRRDRGDPADIQPAIKIPLSKLGKLRVPENG